MCKSRLFYPTRRLLLLPFLSLHNYFRLQCILLLSYVWHFRGCLYKQVGGKADGAADAAPSPSRWRARAPSQAHAAKKTTRTTRKTKPKARRSGAVPANPLWGSAAAFSAAHCFLFIGFQRSLYLLNFASFGRLW